jgi:Mg-chelatase subunit ChlD
MVRHQLQIAADAAALAGVRELVNDDQAAAAAKAVQVASLNFAAGQALILDPAGVEFGKLDAQGTFYLDSDHPNTIKVTLDKTTTSQNGALHTFFAPLVGIDLVELSVHSIASLSDLDVVIVIDRSGSMDDDTPVRDCWWTPTSSCSNYYYRRYHPECSKECEPPPDKQPFTQAQDAAKSFVDLLKGNYDQVAVASYSTTETAPIVQQLTDDFNAAKAAIDAVPDPNGYTCIGCGIAQAHAELTSGRQRASTVKMMLVLSDGMANRPENQGPSYARSTAQAAGNEGIVIHTISLGDTLDRALMQELAGYGQGMEFYAATGEDLATVYEEIAKRVPVRLTG